MQGRQEEGIAGGVAADGAGKGSEQGLRTVGEFLPAGEAAQAEEVEGGHGVARGDGTIVDLFGPGQDFLTVMAGEKVSTFSFVPKEPVLFFL